MINLPMDTNDNWLSALKPYQREPIYKFIEDSGEEKAIELWLTSSGALNTSSFGGGNATKEDQRELITKFKEEFKKFICGDKKYFHDKKEFSELGEKAKTYIVSVISAAIASSLGVSSSLIAPAVVLMIITVTKIGLQAYCQVGE